MNSWWELGDWSGHRGNDLAVHAVACPFCHERGHFSFAHRADKKKPNASKVLHFDTLKCGNCAGYVMVLWSTSHFGGGLHDFLTLPWPLRLEKIPEHWPESVGRYWLQAHRSYADENWDAVAVMARSAVQAAMREKDAQGRDLRAEIDDLADRRILPPHMKEWAHELRELGNESAHPSTDGAQPARSDVADVVKFLDFLFQYLYTLPHEINQYRKRRSRKKPAQRGPAKSRSKDG